MITKFRFAYLYLGSRVILIKPAPATIPRAIAGHVLPISMDAISNRRVIPLATVCMEIGGATGRFGPYLQRSFYRFYVCGYEFSCMFSSAPWGNTHQLCLQLVKTEPQPWTGPDLCLWEDPPAVALLGRSIEFVWEVSCFRSELTQ